MIKKLIKGVLHVAKDLVDERVEVLKAKESFVFDILEWVKRNPEFLFSISVGGLLYSIMLIVKKENGDIYGQ